MVILHEEERVCSVSQSRLIMEPPFKVSNRYLWAKGSAEHNLRSVAFDICVLPCLGVKMGMDLHISEGIIVTEGPSCHTVKHILAFVPRPCLPGAASASDPLRNTGTGPVQGGGLL